MDKIVNYLYIDKDGVDSLVAQLCGTLETEIRVEKSNNHNGKIGAKLGLSDVISKIIKPEISTSAEVGYASKEGITSINTHENKIIQLVNNLQRTNYYFTDINEAMKNSKPDDSCFINAMIPFNTPHDFYSSNYINEIESAGYIYFEHGRKLINGDDSNARTYDTYVEKDCYYKTPQNDDRIVMSLSIEKLTGGYGFTSHMSVIIRGCKCENIPFRVLGQFRNVQNLFYQIKPYAVWLG